jgi:hypothetical protein
LVDVSISAISSKPIRERNWNWIEGAFKKIPAPYPFVSAIIAIVLYVAYMFLLSKLNIIPILYGHIVIIDTFVLIGYLIVGIQYFTEKTKNTFYDLKLSSNECDVTAIYSKLDKKFSQSKSYHAITIAIIIIYLAFPFPSKSDFYYFNNNSIYAATFDIFNILALILVLYLIITVLWIMNNILWSLNQIRLDFKNGLVRIDLFCSDGIGGMRQIRNLVLSLVVYHFMVTSLAIINFVTPGKILYAESIFFTLLFLSGVFFFSKCWATINEILEDKRNSDIESLNRTYEQECQHARNIIMSDDYTQREDKLDQIFKSLEWLQNERQNIMNASREVFNYKAIFAFISSSLLPFITTFIVPIISKVSTHNELLQQVVKFLLGR